MQGLSYAMILPRPPESRANNSTVAHRGPNIFPIHPCIKSTRGLRLTLSSICSIVLALLIALCFVSFDDVHYGLYEYLIDIPLASIQAQQLEAQTKCCNMLDQLSPVAPARIRVVLVPIGQIRRARFLSFTERLYPENIIRLGDISPDGRPNRSNSWVPCNIVRFC